MFHLRAIFTTLLLLNLGTIIFLYFSSDPPLTEIHSVLVDLYHLQDELMGYNILKRLDVFQPVDNKYYDNLLKPGNLYKTPFLSLFHDEYYCDKHRAFIIDHPESIFEELNFLTDWPSSALFRNKVGLMIGNDVQPNISGALPSMYNTSYLFEIKPNVNSFFINNAMHIYQHIGKSFACLFQMYNHIPGHGILNRKDMVAQSILSYAEKYKDRPKCFHFDQFFPKTWLLDDPNQCKEFFKLLKSPDYQKQKETQRIVYIRKRGFGAHRAEGVEPVNQEEEKNIRKLYEDGKFCGKKTHNYIIQNFIHNPLLLEGHKFDFRIYMLVASTHPLILFYHDGFLRVSLHQYDINSNDKGVLLTNTELSKKIFAQVSKGKLFQGMNETQLRDFQMWTFPQLGNHLFKKNIVKDRNWVDNNLRLQFKKAMVHLLRMSQHSFLKRSQLYELFGVDFILDENLNLWFLECNTSPMLRGTSPEKEKFLIKMLKDHYEIMLGLLRSRMKRVISFVNLLIGTIKTQNVTWEEYFEDNYKTLRIQFQDLIMNKFEQEYLPGPENGFQKIIDENMKGIKRYSGLIPEDCL